MSRTLPGRNLPVVSVVMPCRNCATTLPEAMQSLLDQTLDSLEIIAVDGGSTNATPDLLESFARRDHRVQVLSRPFGGVVSALNHGLQAARSGFVARMDADDLAFPNRLAAQTAHLIQNPDLALLGCRVALAGAWGDHGQAGVEAGCVAGLPGSTFQNRPQVLGGILLPDLAWNGPRTTCSPRLPFFRPLPRPWSRCCIC